MTTQASVHTKEVPSFEMTHFETFSTLRMAIRKDGVIATEFIVYLPAGTTHGDIMKSLADAAVSKEGGKRV